MKNISDLKRPGRGYLAAVLGSLGGAAAGGVTAGGLAAVLVSCEGSGLECLGVVVIIFAVAILAAFAGAVAGAYAGLRLRGYERAARTAGLLAALSLPALVVIYLSVDALGIAAPIAAIAGAAVVARRIAIGSPMHGTVIDTKGDET